MGRSAGLQLPLHRLEPGLGFTGAPRERRRGASAELSPGLSADGGHSSAERCDVLVTCYREIAVQALVFRGTGSGAGAVPPCGYAGLCVVEERSSQFAGLSRHQPCMHLLNTAAPPAPRSRLCTWNGRVLLRSLRNAGPHSPTTSLNTLSAKIQTEPTLQNCSTSAQNPPETGERPPGACGGGLQDGW